MEYHWWKGFAACTGATSGGGNVLDAFLNAPLVSCHAAQWSLFGISLAGWKTLISSAAAQTALWLLSRAGGNA